MTALLHSIFDPPSTEPRTASPREAPWTVFLLIVALFTMRVLAADFGAFVEGDDFSIAAGIAALRNHSIGELYRYGPQVGYYRLVYGLSALAGPDLRHIPAIMVWLSVIAGTVIPIAGLLSLRDELSTRQRRLLFVVLAANPILWMSSRYGNTAMLSVSLVVSAFAILSNRPRVLGEIGALALFALAIIVRADAVLATGGIGMLLWRNHRSFLHAAVRVGLTGSVVAAVFALFFMTDPRMAQFVHAVEEHLTNDFPSHFWDYLVWAFSPLVLIFAVFGARELSLTRRWLALTLAAWVLPIVAFYYGAITTPRYFLLLTYPLSIAAAVGIAVAMGPSLTRPALRAGFALMAANLHLAVALGYTIPAHRRSWLTEGSFITHDGPMWTGAFLYKSYVMERPWNASVFSPTLSRMGPSGRTLSAMFAMMGGGEARTAHAVLVVDRGWGYDLHLYAQLANVKIVSMGSEGALFMKQTEMEHGGVQLTAINAGAFDTDSTRQIPVKAGDEFWTVIRSGAPERDVLARLPQGVRLVPLPAVPNAPLLTRYRVEGA
ncbi:MAG: hypothetical protein ABIT38_16270 [Gemmatimonadaceae bacterium]